MTTPPKDHLDVPAAVSRYAGALHGARSTHHVASPLGAWLLLAAATDAALTAGPVPPAQLTALEDQLGMSAYRAGTLARQLFASTPPAVRAATAVWHAADELTPGLVAALDVLSAAATTGPIPSQQQADDWAATSTDGQIEHFPLEVGDDTSLLLATALATTIAWDAPFGDDEPAPAFAWPGGAVRSLMRSAAGHRVELWHSPDGLLAAHDATGNDLRVLSVLSLDPTVPAARVLEHAHTISRALADQEVQRRSAVRPAHDSAPAREVRPLSAEDVFALPLSEAGVLRLTERSVRSYRATDLLVAGTAALPAWSTRTELDAQVLPGLLDAGRALGAHLASWQRHGPGEVDAAQSTVAAFDRCGFSASAVTALAMMRASAAPSMERAVQREVDVRFTHPYAVIASVVDMLVYPNAGAGAWHAVPVFSAWVSEPNAAPEPDTTRAALLAPRRAIARRPPAADKQRDRPTLWPQARTPR